MSGKVVSFVGLCLLSLIIVTTLTAVVNGETIVVDDDAGSWAQYDNIQEAVDNSSADDIVRVYAGTYHPDWVYINWTLSIVGNGSTQTTFDGEMTNDRALQVNADNAYVSDLMIYNYSTDRTAVNINSNWTTVARCNFSYNGDDGLRIGYLIEEQSWPHNVTIEECEFVHNTYGIFATMGRNHVFKDCLFQRNLHGLATSTGYYGYGFNHTIVNCTARLNFGSGFRIGGTGINITQCYAIDNDDYGFYFHNGSLTISECDLTGNEVGIGISNDWKPFAEDLNIVQCGFFNNTRGIHGSHSRRILVDQCNFSGNYRGIYLASNTDDWTIENCSFNNSGDVHIRGGDCDDAEIMWNEFMGHDTAIYLTSGSDGSTIHHNNFMSDANVSSQAKDDGNSNQWDDGEEGNWWSDYNGSDGNGDEIGDTEYVINGSSDSTDRYPLMDPAMTSAPEKVSGLNFVMITLFLVVVIGILFRRRHP